MTFVETGYAEYMKVIQEVFLDGIERTLLLRMMHLIQEGTQEYSVKRNPSSPNRS